MMTARMKHLYFSLARKGYLQSKTADRPHNITIIQSLATHLLAVVAIGFTGFNIKEANTHFRIANRAYVYTRDLTVPTETDGRAYFKISNLGKTPALNLEVYRYEHSNQISTSISKVGGTEVIGPSDTLSQNITVSTPVREDTDLAVLVRYEDVFGGVSHTGFCVTITPPKTISINCTSRRAIDAIYKHLTNPYE